MIAYHWYDPVDLYYLSLNYVLCSLCLIVIHALYAPESACANDPKPDDHVQSYCNAGETEE